jgi:putative CRISPR-associated protein (TIGR02619 family)
MTNLKRDRQLPRDASPTIEDLMQYLNQTPSETASAETNSLARLLEKGDEIVFLRSETSEGRLCTEALQQFYQKRGYRCEVKEIPDLRYEERQFKARGLRALAAAMAEVVRQRRKAGHTVLINATGGFKAEIAYAVLIGQLFDVPVYYIHEMFKDIIEIPPLPVQWDYSLLVNYEDFFVWIEADLRTAQEAHSWLQALPDEIRMLLTEEQAEEQDYVMLSPAGEAFWEAYRYELEREGQQVYISNRAYNYYEQLSPDLKAAFSKLIERLSHSATRGNNIVMMRNSDCLVYPQGHKDERIVFFVENDAVYICELARHSDQSYENLYEHGVRRSQYTDFKPFMP